MIWYFTITAYNVQLLTSKDRTYPFKKSLVKYGRLFRKVDINPVWTSPLIIEVTVTYFTPNAPPVRRRSSSAAKILITAFDDDEGVINHLLTTGYRTSAGISLSDCSDSRKAVKWAGTQQRTSDKEAVLVATS